MGQRGEAIFANWKSNMNVDKAARYYLNKAFIVFPKEKIMDIRATICRAASYIYQNTTESGLTYGETRNYGLYMLERLCRQDRMVAIAKLDYERFVSILIQEMYSHYEEESEMTSATKKWTDSERGTVGPSREE